MRKRILAIVMAVCMMLSVLPTSAFADDEQTEESSGIVYGTYEDGTWTEDSDSTGTAEHENYTLSKTAVATENPNEFEITLTVTTTTTSTTTAAAAAATVLVIDVSGSMNYCAECGGNGSHATDCSKNTNTTGNRGSNVNSDETRIYAAKQAAISFLQSYSGLEFNESGTLTSTTDLSLGRYVSLVAFSSGVTANAWVDVSTISGYNAVLSQINALSADGGTNLHAGLLQADYQLTLDTVKDIASTQKNVIVLTDGAPTFYLTSSSSGMGSTAITIGGTTYYRAGTGSSTTTNVTTATTAAATTLKKSASVYTVCFGVANDTLYSNSTDTTTIGEYLSGSIATAATSDKTYAYNASNADELYAAFAAITEIITGELATMTVTDPMGSNVSNVVLDSSSTDATLEDGTITWTLSSATVVETTDGNTTTYTYTYTYTYTVTVDTSSISDGSETFPLNDATYLTVGDVEYHFPVPAVDGSVLYYTVTYEDGEYGSLSNYESLEGADEATAEAVVYNNLAYGSATPAAPEVTAAEGYYFTGWAPTVTNTVTGSVTYVAQYAEKTALTITIADRNVEYTGSAQSGYGYETSGDGVSTVTGLKDGHSISTVTGYTEATGTAVNTYEGSWDDNYSVVIVDENGKDVTEQYTIAVNPGKLTITNNTTDLAVTADNVTVVYDGESHGVTGTATVDGTATTAATITYVYTDSEGNVLDSEPVDAGTYTVTVTASLAGYSDATTTATVTITKRPVIFTGESAEKVYNGQEQEITGITVSETGEGTGLVIGDSYSELSYSAKGTNAGEYNGAFSGTVVIKNAAGDDVTANYDITQTPGVLTITKITAEIVVTANSATKTYDGTALEDSGYTSTGTGILMDGDELVVEVSGSQTDVGSSANKVTSVKV
ncbi:MAG: VWA domain-containing protein, partial [Oscillospiraceae bacterium]|nr:VWA domain-containing protein [Oscillospiraceae bacterium]